MVGDGGLLLINPYIHDFAAYNLWLRPLGLMRLHDFLQGRGIQTHFVDALFPTRQEALEYGLSWPEAKKYSTGKFPEARIDKPDVYAGMRRYYRRFGIPPELLRARLAEVPRPAGILMTSGMTYWYPGVQETVGILKKAFPQVPILLGGIYATLCTAHAREHSGADVVIPGIWQTALPPVLDRVCGIKVAEEELPRRWSPPEEALYPDSRFGVVRLTTGCPFQCRYCASATLAGAFTRHPYQQVAEEIVWHVAQGRRDIAFYDDALLVEAERGIVPLLESVSKAALDCRFHTPNGLHARYMTQRVADLFRRCKFTTIRLSFEGLSGVARQASRDKVAPTHLENAVGTLKNAGYAAGEIEVYVLIGLPGQKDEEIVDTLRFVGDLGVKAKLADYAPTPGTEMFEVDCRRLPQLRTEPLLHNSTMAAGWDFDWARCAGIKNLSVLAHPVQDKG